jgi:predicted enzyme related to lactoylglutathione lyase
MTKDPAAAAKFYTTLFGWSVEEVPMGAMGTYRLFKQSGKQVAGCMAAQQGMPSAWLTYVASDDVDATAKKIAEHKGKIIVPPTDVPNIVRFAVAMDPGNAAIGVLKGIGPGADQPLPNDPPAPGTFCWDELQTSDQETAKKFYGAIFGWAGNAGDDPMKYWHWQLNGKDIGGMMPLQGPPGVPPHWLSYVAVVDVDASTKKAEGAGAKVLVPTMDIPGTGKFSVLQDPTGAAFAVFRSARV